MNENARIILFGILLFLAILVSRSIYRTSAEPTETFNDNVMLSSVARVAISDGFPSRLSEIPVVAQIPEFVALEPIPAPETPRAKHYKPKVSDIDSFISAVAGVVIDLDSSDILWERRMFQRHPLASLTKLMTAIVAAENIGLDTIIPIADIDVLSEGDAGDFKSGESFTVRDLIAAMLLASANDAADALARFYGTKPFVDAMQQKAAEFGMTNTSFFDPSGLSSLNQSTVYDLIAFVKALRASYPQHLILSSAKEYAILEQISKKPRVIKSINAFAGDPNFIGGKTGYTPEAHGNLLSVFNVNGRTVLIVVLGTDDRFGETRLLYEWVKKQS